MAMCVAFFPDLDILCLKLYFNVAILSQEPVDDAALILDAGETIVIWFNVIQVICFWVNLNSNTLEAEICKESLNSILIFAQVTPIHVQYGIVSQKNTAIGMYSVLMIHVASIAIQRIITQST